MIARSARLQWGDVALISEGAPDGLPYVIEASADGTHWGTPEAVVTAVQSRLQDGSLAVVDSFENREAPIYLQVTSDTYDGLAAGEEALVAETRRPGYNTLSWTPNEALAVPSVFDVAYAVLSFQFDDLSELRLKRRFVATLNCLPFPRAATEVVAEAVTPPPSTPIVTSVDTGSSATGWTGSPTAAAVVSGAVQTTAQAVLVDACASITGWSAGAGADIFNTDGNQVLVQDNNGAVGSYMSMTRTGTFSTSATPYVAIDIRATQFINVEVFFNGSGTPATLLAAGPGARDGYTRHWFQAPGASVTSILFRQQIGGPDAHYIGVELIYRTDVNPTIGVTSLTRTGSITGLATTPYLMIDYTLTQTGMVGQLPLEILLDGVVTNVLYTQLISGNLRRAYVRAPGSSVATVVLRSPTSDLVPTAGTVTKLLSVDQIQKTDAGPSFGSRRQLSRTLPVAGTMRTQGQLAIQHETNSLGEVLAYCYQANGVEYVPALRPFYFSGGAVTADTTLVSGASNMLDTAVEYRVPVIQLVGGHHAMYARVKGDSAGPVTLNIAAHTRIGTTDVAGSITFSVTLDLTTSYQILDLGPLSLPATLVPRESGAVMRITIVDASNSGIDVTLDEAWLFNLDIGTLNHVDCGTGTPAAGGPARRLWFDPATVTNDGEDAVFCGHSADRTDAFHPATNIKGWTPPLFEPDTMSIFTVTTNTFDASVELRHFPRFLHNARAVAA